MVGDKQYKQSDVDESVESLASDAHHYDVNSKKSYEDSGRLTTSSRPVGRKRAIFKKSEN